MAPMDSTSELDEEDEWHEEKPIRVQHIFYWRIMEPDEWVSSEAMMEMSRNEELETIRYEEELMRSMQVIGACDDQVIKFLEQPMQWQGEEAKVKVPCKIEEKVPCEEYGKAQCEEQVR